MNNIDKLNIIQTEVARTFENLDLLINLEKEIQDVQRILEKAVDKGHTDIQRECNLLIMRIEKNIYEIIDNTQFLKLSKKRRKFKYMIV